MAKYIDESSIAITYDPVAVEDEATEIFENMRVALIKTKEREKELEGSKRKGKKLYCI